MKNDKNQSSVFLYVLNITLRLVAICAVIALLVATVNFFAAPVIQANNEKATSEAISRLFDGTDVVTTEIAVTIPETYVGIVDTIYGVEDATSAEFLGYCTLLSPTGFKGEVDLIAAFDEDAFIKGVEITSTNDETSGIGTKVKDASFTEKFIEVSGEAISTNVKDYIISGATKTSKPVTEAVFAAKNVISSIVTIWPGAPAPAAGEAENEETQREADE
ncbi:MAG: FMN-binding protein [Clostridia bacterium]|nr:FMN-binding protein [Clostridia bacterium]